MGRELRRVPLDFDWPLHEVWKGYVNPHYKKCPDSNCSAGYVKDYYVFEDLMRLLSLAAEAHEIRPEDFEPSSEDCGFFENMYLKNKNRDQKPGWLWPEQDIVEIFAKAAGWDVSEFSPEMTWNLKLLAGLEFADVFTPYRPMVVATGREQNYPHPFLAEKGVKDLKDSPFNLLMEALGGERRFFGGYECWNPMKAIYKALGYPYTTDENGWESFPHIICQHCGGEGIDPECLEAYEAWSLTPPPEGEGFQLWETTSEGSPVSPVFETFEELCAWCEEGATTFGKFKTTKEEWAKMLDDGFVYHQEGNMVFM